jgi:hypothetical protein
MTRSRFPFGGALHCALEARSKDLSQLDVGLPALIFVFTELQTPSAAGTYDPGQSGAGLTVATNHAACQCLARGS